MFAAMDSTSSVLARTLDILSTRQDVQDKLRQEILEARERNNGEEFDYETLANLPYLNAVCKEVIRLYPPAHRIIRTYVPISFDLNATFKPIAYPTRSYRDSVVPLGTPITGTDGSQITEIFFPKGSDIWISLIGANRSEEIWGPDAKEWKPERWLSPFPPSVAKARIPGVYANTMTFSAGPRACIGFKFTELEMVAVLPYLIESFKFEPSGKEIYYDLSGVANPKVKGELDKGIQLPIKITAVKSEN
ncbi:hypothetical protein WG66_008812 [Moniliophthora roreri]|nr:hypothetical protein WG66_008812 [Moniliophthora roreri]